MTYTAGLKRTRKRKVHKQMADVPAVLKPKPGTPWPACGNTDPQAVVSDDWDDVTCLRCLRYRDSRVTASRRVRGN